jgi:short-subunit dehydrogenase
VEIEGKRILVTGASSGIGEQLAPQLAAKGAVVGIVARRADRLEAVLEKCREHTPESAMWAVDLGDLDAAERVVEDAWSAFGGLDCLVNNAAMGKRKTVLEQSTEEIETVMRLNFFSPIRMGQVAAKKMRERGSGLIVNVSSMGGRLGISHESSYCASKYAMAGWSEVMFMDLLGTGVDVKLVLPGPIKTEIWETQPGELPGFYDGPWVMADDCAADIVTAIEGDGFEYYVPEEVFPGFVQKDLIVGKSGAADDFLRGMAAHDDELLNKLEKDDR